MLKELSAQGRQKAALDAAKTIHTHHQTVESEKLLAECYLDRIQGFLDKNMMSEAMGLVELVRDRFPSVRDQLASYQLKIELLGGNLNGLLSPLKDTDLPLEQREAIEDIIRREVTDPSLIAQCEALPPDHALRRAAAEVWQAFRLVCSGPVEDDQIALSSVSRKSPLAPWKILVRAIAAFYRRDDQTCQKLLDNLASDSVPARFSPVLLSAMGTIDFTDLSPEAQILESQIVGFPEAFHQSLEKLEKMIGTDNGNLIPTIRKALTECKRSRPELLKDLKQRIYTYGFVHGEHVERLFRAIGEPPYTDAAYWQQMAGGFSMADSPVHSLAAWEEFRLHAINEKLFEHGSLEESVLYQTMAKICIAARSSPNDSEFEEESLYLQENYFEFFSYESQPPNLREAVTPEKRDSDPFYFLDPDKIFSRSCVGGDPDESYSLWLEMAKRYSGVRNLDRIAEKWRQASPHSVKPLLHLAETAERRKAYKKALSLVEEAENLDELNPAVRRMRLRLQISSAGRHIQQRKKHLLAKDIQALETLPMIREGDRPALISGLNWVSAIIDSNDADSRRYFEALTDFFHSPLAAWLLGQAFCQFGGLKMSVKIPAVKEWTANGSVVDAVTRVQMLGNESGVKSPLPERVQTHLVKLLKTKNPVGTAVQFRVLAESALQYNHMDLAYTAAGAGLALGGFTEARFLYLRVFSMPPFPVLRRIKCLSVAIHLAKNQGDQELLGLAMETLRDIGGYRNIEAHNQSDPTPDEVDAILRLEKELRDPENQGEAMVKYGKLFGDEPRSFGPHTIEIDDFDDDFGDDDDDDYFGEFGEDPYEDDFDDAEASPLGLDAAAADRLEQLLKHDAAYPQMGLFPDNPLKTFLKAVFKLAKNLADRPALSGPVDVVKAYPERTQEIAEAIQECIEQNASAPPLAESIQFAMEHADRKRAQKRRQPKKKTPKKRKKR